MARNPVQFQRGISLNQFLSLYGTEHQCFDPSLTLVHACLCRTGGGGAENQGVAEVIARYRLELHRYMHGEWNTCMSPMVRISLDTCICASPTKNAPTAPC